MKREMGRSIYRLYFEGCVAVKTAVKYRNLLHYGKIDHIFSPITFDYILMTTRIINKNFLG